MPDVEGVIDLADSFEPFVEQNDAIRGSCDDSIRKDGDCVQTGKSARAIRRAGWPAETNERV
jgi:hypothetical protein